MNSDYTERLKKHIGEAPEGRTDFFDLTREESINMIKEKLKDNFSCNLWTLEWSDAEIEDTDKALTEAHIIHVYDEIMDAINCFRSVKDMKGFYDRMRKEAKEEDLKFMREHHINTPIIKWYD